MITQKQFEAHPSYRKELADMLDHPTMIAAIEVCEQIAKTPVPYPGGGLDLIQFAALTGARKEGHFEAFLNLRSLAKVPRDKLAEPVPWKHPEPRPSTTAA